MVGFTGGLRSSILAMLLRQQGHEVSALHLDFSDFPALQAGASDPWTRVLRPIGNSQAAKDAARQAETLGIDLKVVQAGALFDQKVADPALHAAMSRRDEDPGILFHSELLVPALAMLAREGGFDRWAAGHAVLQDQGVLLEGSLPGDQLRLVAFASPADLEMGLFPLGMFSPSHLQKLGEQLDLGAEILGGTGQGDAILHPAQAAPELWDAWAVQRLPPELQRPGWIRNPSGSTGLREHRGLYQHPVGLALHTRMSAAKPEPEPSQVNGLYSIDFEPANHTVWALKPEEFKQSTVTVEGLRWRESSIPATGTRVRVLVCGGARAPIEATGMLHFHANSTGRLDLTSPCELLFLGTRLIFTRDQRVLGSARISSRAHGAPPATVSPTTGSA